MFSGSLLADSLFFFFLGLILLNLESRNASISAFEDINFNIKTNLTKSSVLLGFLRKTPSYAHKNRRRKDCTQSRSTSPDEAP